ncbi:poly polymerase catalytic domain-containing protein [Microdochium trichocladiopsis]|uniref:Poly [ADP-ribose] polymerase n=1 Tax=Microdochium trichocladiopsis TaxID=1682393 RepID=A0A9P8XT26_9PEZI|nr:poly polymerase catalytic domain-containing protein [Microdochium trichocladiopsis]KAH7010769.1 poly polymerase catalytic domain-containing protein [Microdochium trichocladiopsis]
MFGSLAQPTHHVYSCLKYRLRRLTDPTSAEWRDIFRYLHGSNQPAHKIRVEVQGIYALSIEPNSPNDYQDWIHARELARLQAYRVDESTAGRAARHRIDTKRLLLWHGTPIHNVISILETGLRTRPPNCTARRAMFGKAIYLADASSKSANYCGSQNGEEAVLFLCEADVGRGRVMHEQRCRGGDIMIQDSEKEKRCVQGVGLNQPAGWKPIRWRIAAAPATSAGEVEMVGRNTSL